MLTKPIFTLNECVSFMNLVSKRMKKESTSKSKEHQQQPFLTNEIQMTNINR